MTSKGVANASYAAVASAALVTGLLLLSFSGGIFSLTGQAPGDPGAGGLDPDLEEADLPDGSLDPGRYVDQDTVEAAARQDGVITTIARSLFEFLSGQDIQPPDLPAVNGSTGSSPSDGSINGSINGTDGLMPNGTEGGTNVTDGPGPGQGNVSGGGDGTAPGGTNTSTGGGDETNRSVQDDTDDPDGTDGGEGNRSGSDPTDDDPDTPGTDGQDPSMPGNESRSGGVLGDILEQVSELLTGGQQDRNGENGSSGDEAGSGTDEGGGDGAGGARGGLGPVQALLPLVVIGIAVAGLLVVRSDRGWREVLAVLLDRARSFVRQLPDMVRRVVVGAVSAGLEKIVMVAGFLRRFIGAPRRVAAEVLAGLSCRAGELRDGVKRLRGRSVRETIGGLLGGGGRQPEGLDRIWLELKVSLGLEPETTLTPLEIGREAIEQGFPAETVKEIVAALRAEKYAGGYEEELRLGRWEQSLWGESSG